MSKVMGVQEVSPGYEFVAENPAVPVGYKQTDVGVIPEDWGVFQVGEVSSKVGSGVTPTGGSRVYTSSGRPFVRSQNVGWGCLELNDIAYIDESIHATFSGTEVHDSDVLLNITGASIGRAAVADKRVVGGNVNQHVCIIRAKQDVLEPRFLGAFLISSYGQKQIDSFQAGGNRQGLNFKQVSSINLPAPENVEEQRAIATALSDVDALLEELDRLIAKKRDIKQAAMQQLLTGETRLPGFEGAWETKRLGECLVGTPNYGINAPAVPFSDRLPTYIRITDINNGRFDPSPRVSVNSHDADNYRLEPGDVVFARTGASVGKTYAYNEQDGILVFAGFLIRVRTNPDVLLHDFLAAFTTTGAYWNWVSVNSMRSGQPGINGNEYARLEIPFPSVDEQKAIMDILSEMDTEIQALEQRRSKTAELKQGMMQELLTGRTRLV